MAHGEGPMPLPFSKVTGDLPTIKSVSMKVT
jgi:hypothetical protein